MPSRVKGIRAAGPGGMRSRNFPTKFLEKRFPTNLVGKCLDPIQPGPAARIPSTRLGTPGLFRLSVITTESLNSMTVLGAR